MAVFDDSRKLPVTEYGHPPLDTLGAQMCSWAFSALSLTPPKFSLHLRLALSRYVTRSRHVATNRPHFIGKYSSEVAAPPNTNTLAH